MAGEGVNGAGLAGEGLAGAGARLEAAESGTSDPGAVSGPRTGPARAARRSSASRTATSRAARRRLAERAANARPTGRSAVEALLVDYPGARDGQTAQREAARPVDVTGSRPAKKKVGASDERPPARAGDADREPSRDHDHDRDRPLDGRPVAVADSPRPPTTLTTKPVHPPMPDVALGLAALIASIGWNAGSWGVAAVSRASTRTAEAARAISPTFATELFDAQLVALAERGRSVRTERTQAAGVAVTTAITAAATSDALRQLSVAAIEEATDDVLAVVLPAMLEAVTELETQEKLDELLAGLLVRQLPSALEKTLPGVMMRTATRPAAGLMPFLNGVLPKG